MLPERDGSVSNQDGNAKDALVKQYSNLHNNGVLFEDEKQHILDPTSNHDKKIESPTSAYPRRSSWDDVDILERLELEDLDDDFAETLDIKPKNDDHNVSQPPKMQEQEELPITSFHSDRAEQEELPVTSFHSDRAGNIILGTVDGKILAWNGKEILEADEKDAKVKTTRSSKGSSRRSSMSSNNSHKGNKKKKEKTSAVGNRRRSTGFL